MNTILIIAKMYEKTFWEVLKIIGWTLAACAGALVAYIIAALIISAVTAYPYAASVLLALYIAGNMFTVFAKKMGWDND